MKLRIKGDNLRLRLTRGEVARFAVSGALAETMHLPDGAFTYALYGDDRTRKLSARLGKDGLIVEVPRDVVRHWADSEEVSLRGRVGPLSILIEKDFACLQPREGEDESDAYPHPQQSTGGEEE